MRTLLRKMTEALERITGTGATLNAWREVDRAATSVLDLDAQLQPRSAPPGGRSFDTSRSLNLVLGPGPLPSPPGGCRARRADRCHRCA